jgi:multidrug efflux pump
LLLNNQDLDMGKGQKIDKKFGLTSLALKNGTTVLVLTALIIIMGITTYVSLPRENFPELNIPQIYVGVVHPGNSPADMENLITRPIERQLNTISEIDNITSTSIQDYATIIAEFDADMDVDEALRKVKDAVDKAKPDLPTDLEADPDIFQIDVNEFPILNINLSGNYTPDELKGFAEYLEDEIEKIPEISKAEIRGLGEKEVKIKVDPYKLEAVQLNFGDLENAISSENITMSGGSYINDGVRRTVRIEGEFDDPMQLLEVVVKNEDDDIVYLRDVATVEFDYKDKANYARLWGEPVVMIDVVKRQGENLLDATAKLGEVLQDARDNVLPADLEVVVTNDQSLQTKKMVSNLENSIIFGVILVVLVLLFFLGTRNAMFVGVAIPLSMFMSFLILGMFDISINMMVLFSLIMALGMLVDNGIVVVENVYRLMEEGMSPIEATMKGVGEVALPIISSTATTLAAFLPLAFWPGIMGEFMKYLPITLIITLGSSLFVALVINPVLIKLFMQVDDRAKINHKVILRNLIITVLIGFAFLGIAGESDVLTVIGNVVLLIAVLMMLNIYLLTPMSRWFQDKLLPALERWYEATIRLALNYMFSFFFGTVGLLVIAIMLLGAFTPNVIFFPENEPKYVNVFIEMPIGTDIEATNEFTEKVNKRIDELIVPHLDIIESVITNVGQGATDPNDPSSIGSGDSPHKARVTINFVEIEERGRTLSSEVMEEIRAGLRGYAGVTVTVDKDANGPPVGKPISIEVSGDDFEGLIEITEQMKQFINESGIEGIEKLKSNLELGKPELRVDIDREKARRFGLSTYSIANELRTGIFGKEISKFKQGEDDYDIQVRLDDKYRYDVDALMNKNITFRNQTNGKMHQVPIASVAKAELTSTYGSIRRKDLKRVITLSSNVIGGYNATVVNQQIAIALNDFNMPSGYEYKFGGEQESQAEEMAFLSQALLIAVFLIFLIIVSQFNKLTAPFIIMMSVLFSTIGVFFGLVTFQMEFVVMMTMVGIISLAGIVVNNAIVLIDFIELSRKRRREKLNPGERLPMEEIKESIVLAGKTRLRPVLLTAITTILGLIPLAVGLNIDFLSFFVNYDPNFFIGGDSVIFWGPMSWTIIFGLTFATLVTLVIVPVMYLFFDKLNYKFGLSKY